MYKPVLRAGPRPCIGWKTVALSLYFFLKLYMTLTVLSSLCFNGMSMCTNTCVYESVSVCAFFFAFFFCFMFVLHYTMAYFFYFILFHIIAIISLFIFCDERVRECGFGWVEK